MSAPSGEQIVITLADQQAVIVEAGGGLRTYSVGRRELLDGFGIGERATSGRGQVLIPWPNRLQDGRYEFDDRRHQLPLNEPDQGNAIHGLVRWSAWTVALREPDRAVLEHHLYPQPGYPFSLALRIEYLLTAAGLRVRTMATNAGQHRCPYGSGAHPYLSVGTPLIDTAMLNVPGRSMLCSNERGIPIGATPVEGTDYDFLRARPIGTTKFDHAYTELVRDEDGLARVRLWEPDSGDGLMLWVDETYPYLMLFSGDGHPDIDRRSLAVEPMTCPPNAFRTGDSLIILEPGESFTSTWGIDVVVDASHS